jgi:hypothetical protein
MLALFLIFNNFSDQNFFRGVDSSEIRSILSFFHGIHEGFQEDF